MGLKTLLLLSYHIHFPHIEPQLSNGYLVHVGEDVSQRPQFLRSELLETGVQESPGCLVVHGAWFVVLHGIVAHQFEVTLKIIIFIHKYGVSRAL